MRIQHNIMAMNAYRNYTNNNSALSKNLEKLSSGYKINRAGDDAAGLAISEKMRAQITGLNAAQKNVKDGVSLVKTAEGAMQEIHDMLNRMDYLATQSANGTYDNEVDRKNLQKEVDALKTEINRIADSANFNGIKLLDGSMDAEIKESSTLKLGSMTAADTSMILPGVEKNAANGTNAANAASSANGTTAAGSAAAKKEDVKTSFAIDLNDLDITWDKSGNIQDDDKVAIQLNFGRKTSADPVAGEKKDIVLSFTFTGAEAKAKGLFNDDGKLNVDKLSKALADDLKAAGTDEEGYWKARLDIAGVANGDPDDYSGFNVKVDADTNQMLFKLDNLENAKEEELNLNWNSVSDRMRVDVMSKPDGGDVETVGTNKVSIDPDSRVNGWKDGMQDPSGIIGTNTIVYKDVGEPRKTNFFLNLEDVPELTATDLAKMTNANGKVGFKIDFGSQYVDANGKTQSTGVIFDFTKDEIEAAMTDTDNDGTVDTLTSEKLVELIKGQAEDADGNPVAIRAVLGDNVCDHTNPDGTGGYSGFDVKTEGTGLRFILHNVNMAHPSEANANWGDVSLSFVATTNANPTAMSDFDQTLIGGDGTHGWSVGATDMHDGVLPGQNTFANTVLDMKDTGFDINNAANNDGYTISADGKTFVLAVGDDSAVAKADLGDSGAIVVKVNKDASVDKQLQELANAMNKNCETWEVGATDRNSTANYGLSFRQRETGASAKDKAGHDLTTVEGIAGSISFGKANVKNVAEGKALTLQIGDTSEEFNQMKVSVGDMHSEAMGIGDVDISTQEGAAAAVQKIKDAINYVSDVRGTLGATQNRLEHTANNLSVMAENIQDAESTIRDTDVAEEMMSYVKNNILIQSAQAMLAQANQVPQGVLQLLG